MFSRCLTPEPSWPARHADRRLQYYAGPVDQSQDTAKVQGDMIVWCHTADCAQCGRAMGLDVPHAIEDIMSYS
jgi:hypothetical protein